MFAYFSALVELGYFDTVYLNFLVVGHTHGPDDQYFSVLSKKIHWARFIGSPLAFDELLKIAHAEPEHRPYVVRRIRVFYGVRAVLTEFINTKIKYYSIPHAFKISLEKGKAVFRYKLFSKFDEWLPRSPRDDDIEGNIALIRHSAVGGMDNFVRRALGQNDDITLQRATNDQRTFMTHMTAVERHLETLDSESIAQMQSRMQAQCDGLDGVPEELSSRWNKAIVETYMERSSKLNEGKLLFILSFVQVAHIVML
jgi:hypothetical protein